MNIDKLQQALQRHFPKGEVDQFVCEYEKLKKASADYKEFVEFVFMKDKTPAYCYRSGVLSTDKKRYQDRFGKEPGSPGRRWFTPFEMAYKIAREGNYNVISVCTEIKEEKHNGR